MEVTKLSDDEIEILIQLYDSLVDVLERKKGYDIKIEEQIEKVKRVENELSDLKKKYNELDKNKKVISIDEAKKTSNILSNLETKKKQRKELIDISGIMLKEYVVIINEIKKIFDDIHNVEEIETLSTSQGIKIDSLNTVVHIKRTDLNTIITNLNAIENSIISETTIDVVNEIIERFKSNEEEVLENNNPHEMLVKLYNSMDIQKEENEVLLSEIPGFIERVKLNKSVKENNKNENTQDLKDIVEGKETNITNDSINEKDEDYKNYSNILPIKDEEVNLHVDSNLEQPNKEPIDLNIPIETLSQNLNNENSVSEEKNKIVGMPNLDLPISNLTQTSNIESLASEVKVPTFEVPAPNIPVNIEPKVDVNNNVPLNENEVNSILAGNKVEEPAKTEEVSEVIIKEPSEPSKIANSTEAKVQTILGVWSKYKAPKTIIKSDIKNDENIVSLDAILSGSDNSKNTPQNDIQSFFSNAA